MILIHSTRVKRNISNQKSFDIVGRLLITPILIAIQEIKVL